jgi:gluconate 2-dehydrogenase gamma chain
MASGRREFLRQLALLSASLAAGAGAGCRRAPTASPRTPTFDGRRRAVLEAVCARIVPTDSEPGATEAGCAEFIDRQLGLPHFDALRTQVDRGLEHLDGMAQRRLGRGFTAASAAEQDELLRAFHKAPRGVQGAYVFSLLLTLTLEGFLSDPVHGGNRNQVGWAFVGRRDCFYHGRGVGLRKKTNG